MILKAHLRDSNWFERLVLKKSVWLTFIIIGFAIPLLRSFQRELPQLPPVLYSLPQYSLVNQFGMKFGSDELEGKVYIANFIFTSCATSCKGQMKSSVGIQHRIKNLKSAASIITFTVDPVNDTPKVLLKYSRDLNIDHYNWKFLTGNESQIKDLLIKGFKVPMEAQPTGDVYDIAHSERFVLVDQKGKIRGYYKHNESDIDKLIKDTGLLVNIYNYNLY